MTQRVAPFRTVALGLGALTLLATALTGCGGAPGGARPGSHGYNRLPAATVSMLQNKPPSEVRQRLGAPSLTRREPPAEIWQYGSSSCVIDIVFYPTDSGTLSADWLDSRALDGGPIDKDRCLKSLAE